MGKKDKLKGYLLSGGYVILPRNVHEILRTMQPIDRDIYYHLYMSVFYQPANNIKAGQRFVKASDIVEELSHWSPKIKPPYSARLVNNSLRRLERKTLLKTERVTWGRLISVNYFNELQQLRSYRNTEENTEENTEGFPKGVSINRTSVITTDKTINHSPAFAVRDGDFGFLKELAPDELISLAKAVQMELNHLALVENNDTDNSLMALPDNGRQSECEVSITDTIKSVYPDYNSSPTPPPNALGGIVKFQFPEYILSHLHKNKAQPKTTDAPSDSRGRYPDLSCKDRAGDTNPDGSSQGDDKYYYYGNTINLTKKNFDEWRLQFKEGWRHVHQFEEVLDELDKYYTDNPPKDGKWYFPVYNNLRRKHDYAVRLRNQI